MPKVEKGIIKIYGMTIKKLADVDPKKLDALLKMKDKWVTILSDQYKIVINSNLFLLLPI